MNDHSIQKPISIGFQLSWLAFLLGALHANLIWGGSFGFAPDALVEMFGAHLSVLGKFLLGITAFGLWAVVWLVSTALMAIKTQFLKVIA